MVYWLLGMALPAFASPTVERLSVTGRWRHWRVADGAEVVLRFTGDLDGDPDPCPCTDGRAGGVARIVALHRFLGPDGLLVDVGNHFRATPDRTGLGLDADAVIANERMTRALSAYDVVGLGFRDRPAQATGLPVASAMGTPDRWWRRTVGDVEVWVTSVSSWGMGHVGPAEPWPDPVDALRSALVGVPDAALIVVLGVALADPDAVLRLRGVDVLVEARRDEDPVPAVVVGDAVWARSARNGWLGELRLDVVDGQVTAARDRHLPIDERAPEDRAVREALSAEAPVRSR